MCEAISKQDNGLDSVLRETTRASGCKTTCCVASGTQSNKHPLWALSPRRGPGHPVILGLPSSLLLPMGDSARFRQSSMQVTANLQASTEWRGWFWNTSTEEQTSGKVAWVRTPALWYASGTQSKLADTRVHMDTRTHIHTQTRTRERLGRF